MTEPKGHFHRARSTAPAKSSAWGVVLLAHGSQRGNDTHLGLLEVVNRLQAVLGEDQARVVLACLEFIEPHPGQAIHSLADQGFRQVAVMPYLLGHGKHATLELEEALSSLREELPGVDLHLTEGLGSDPRMAEMVMERVLSVHHPAPGNPPNPPLAKGGKGGFGGDSGAQDGPIGVLLVKAGTKNQYDDCLWLMELGRMVEARLGSGYVVEVAQSHYGDPTMDDAGLRLVEERGASSVVCVPYLFFPGLILRRNVLGGLERLKQKYPWLPAAVASPLGVDDRLVAIAADRVREMWAGQRWLGS